MKTSSYDIDRAIETMNSLQLETREDLEKFHQEALLIESWLGAEARHGRSIQSWLDAEQKHHYQQWLLENLDTYRCAKAGWLKMREASPRLDGVTSFGDLGTGLQMRYARFAQGVMKELGVEASIPEEG